MKTITISGDKTNKVNDTSTILKFIIWNDGVPQNETGHDVKATIANGNGYLFDEPMTVDGYELLLDFASDNLRKLTAGDYSMEIKVTNDDKDVEIYPTNGAMSFTVTQDLTASDSNLLPIVTFDALLKSVDEKIDKYKETIAKGDKGDTGRDGVNGENGKDGVDGWQDISVSTETPLNLDGVTFNQHNNHNVLVLTDAFNLFSKAVVVDDATSIYVSLDVKALTGGGQMVVLFFDSANKAITSTNEPLQFKIGDWKTYEQTNVTVPTNAHTAILKIYSEVEGAVIKVSEPVLDTGNRNLIANAGFSTGLDNWFGDASLTVSPDAISTYLDVDNSNINYKIEVGSALSGTLPNGVIRGKMSGSKLTVVGASENGVGGLTQTLVIHGKTYQRSFGYQWYDWQAVTGIYGSFDSAGVWHSPYGQPVLGGIIFNPDDDQYYALAPDGKPYTTTGWQTLPIGVNKANLTVKLAENGAIDSDISDSDVVENYIAKVNSYVDKLDDLGSTHVVVTDSHGTSTNNVMKTFDRTMSGYQYAKLKKDVITPATMYVSDDDIANMTSNYFSSISRKYANRSSLNIQRITSKFNKQPLVYSHLGDVEDGRNANATEEQEGYVEGAANFLAQGFNMIDGNHDEQIYNFERMALSYSGKKISSVVNGIPFSRRKYEDRWHDSYGKYKSYYSTYDDKGDTGPAGKDAEMPVIGGRNLYITATQVPGYVHGGTGEISAQDSTNKEMMSDYIAVLPNTEYTFQAWGSLPAGQQYWAGIGQYDKNKAFVRRYPDIYDAPTVTTDVPNDYEKTTVTTDANTYFVRVSSRTFGNYRVKFEKGNVATDWTSAPEDIHEHKLVYIYLDVFEGDKVRYAHQPTPNFGLPLGQAKLTAAQIDWLATELLKVPDDHFVVINVHMLPDPSLIGETPTGKVANSWWKRNINPDVLANLLIAFQKSEKYSGSSLITDVGRYDFSDYQANVNVDFTGKPANRIAVINYGHHHAYGHTDKTTNGNFNIVQFPNMLGKTWGYIGNPSSSQFGTEIFDVTNRKMTVVRFAPTDDQDAEFTLDF